MARRRYQRGSVFLRGKRHPAWFGRWREDVIDALGPSQRGTPVPGGPHYSLPLLQTRTIVAGTISSEIIATKPTPVRKSGAL